MHKEAITKNTNKACIFLRRTKTKRECSLNREKRRRNSIVIMHIVVVVVAENLCLEIRLDNRIITSQPPEN